MKEVYELIPLLAAIANLALGVFVLTRDPRMLVNRLFAAIAGLLALWSIVEFATRVAGTRYYASIGTYITAVAWALIGAVFVHFCMAFSGWSAASRRKYLSFVYAPCLVFLALAWFTNLLVKGYELSPGPGQGYRDIAGPLSIPSKLFVMVLLIVGIVIVYSFRRRTLSPIDRTNATYVIIAAVVPIVTAAVTDILLPAINRPARVSSVSVAPIMVLIVAYAVTRHDLLTSIAGSVGYTIINSIGEAVLITDSSGIVKTVNPAACRLTGYGEEELLGSAAERLFVEYPPQTAFAKDDTDHWQLLLTGSGEAVPVTRSDGTVDRRGSKKAGTVVVLHDMRHTLQLTELEREAREAVEVASLQSRRSEVLERSREELREQSQFLQSVIDNLAEPVFIKDGDLRYIYINRAALDLFATEAENILGKTCHDVFPEELAVEFERTDREAIATGDLVEFDELRMPEGSGGTRVVRIYKAPIKDESGRDYVIGVINDLTAQKQLDDARLDFIRIAAHELKTPMTSLKLSLELLSRETRDILNDEQRRWLDVLSISIQRLNLLARNLLDLASLDTGLHTLEIQDISLLPFLFEAASVFEVQLLEKGLKCEVDCPEGLPRVSTDPGRLSQVLFNLMSNAIKYTEKGSIDIRARDGDDGMVEVCVTDTGIGISPMYLSAIFSRFSKGGGAERAKEGTGLGLSIAKAIVDALGGKIWVESTPGEGSSFYFTLRKAGGRLS